MNKKTKKVHVLPMNAEVTKKISTLKHTICDKNPDVFIVDNKDFEDLRNQENYVKDLDFMLTESKLTREVAKLGSYGEPYFPSGATDTAASEVGPSAAKHGNNPLFSFLKMNPKFYEILVDKYIKYKENKQSK